MKKWTFLWIVLATSAQLVGQTIAEKKSGLKKSSTDLDPQVEAALTNINQELEESKNALRTLYAEVRTLHAEGGSEEEFAELLEAITAERSEISRLSKEWMNVSSETTKSDIYSLWHQPETTIGQLVIDFGSAEHLYVMSPEISEMRLSVNSSVPIPRAEWETILSKILTQNGIGIRETGPYLRELYLTEEGASIVRAITSSREDLHFLPQGDRIAFILTPPATEVRRITAFLNKFVNPKSATVEQFGRDVIIVSQVNEVQDLLKLYDFMAENQTEREYKLVPLRRIKAEEMARVVAAMFDQIAEDPVIIEEDGKAPKRQERGDEEVAGLKLIVLDSLSQALFLVGTKDEIRKTEELIQRVENSIAGGAEKAVQWYTARYTAAGDLAVTLQQIYTAMVRERIGKPAEAVIQRDENGQTININNNENLPPGIATTLFDNSYFLNGTPVIDPGAVNPGFVDSPADQVRSEINTPNFIVDEKTSSVIMVVDKEYLSRINDIVAKLDTPKKMVQIDILLFERNLVENTDYGLNLLRIGGAASNTRNTSFTFQDIARGVTEFMLSRPKTDCMPAFDLTYRFLMTQQHVRLNANPSVVTLNQVPARVTILDEISISTGVNFIDSTNSNVPRASFARAQYGITIDVTPTVHLNTPDNPSGDNVDYITLKSDIYFDTIDRTTDTPERPPVNRRNITNEVMVPDGQTIVLGGLRKKESADRRDAIPLVGEIPGFGKLFSFTTMEDRSTEMIIFLTPKIIYDPCVDIERIKMEKLSERPGDLPYFMCRMNESRECQIHDAYRQTVMMVCGRPRDRYYDTQMFCVPAPSETSCSTCREYDGR